MSLATDDHSVYLPLSHPDSDNHSLEEIRNLFASLDHPDRRWVFHNAKFDWAFLDQIGVHLQGHTHWDTGVGAWLEDENLTAKLKDRSALLFPDEDPAAEQRALRKLCAGPTLAELEDEYYDGKRAGITRKQARELAEKDPRYGHREMWDLTAVEMAPYAAKDAELTLALYRYQASLDHRHPIGVAMPREMEVQRLLYAMERTGVRVDAGRAEQAHAAALRRLEELTHLFEAVNLNAPHQVAELVYEKWGFSCRSRTPNDNPSVDRDALECLGDDPRIVALLECRRLTKAVTAYYRPLISALDVNDRIHPSFKSTGTRTGRFSCEHPNLQTIPREDTLAEVRRVFVPAPGLELWEFDLAQAEVRVAAAISRDQGMVDAFADPAREFYTEVAQGLGCSRATAKRIVLSYNYGAGDEKLAAIVLKGSGRAVTPADVRQVAKFRFDFARLYPALARAGERFADLARQDGRLPLHPPGRYRHFRGAFHKPEEYRKAFNSLCQGTVGELVKDLMLASRPVFDELGARLLLQVHDSLVVEVPPGAGPLLARRLAEVVNDVNPFPIVRHEVEGKLWASSPSAVSPLVAGEQLTLF